MQIKTLKRFYLSSCIRTRPNLSSRKEGRFLGNMTGGVARANRRCGESHTQSYV